jgi:1,4-alpha-glucan branching enzyme
MSHGEQTTLDELIDAVASGRSDNPFAVLGRHRVVVDDQPALVIRTMQPEASDVQLVTPDRVYGMQRRRPQGLYQATVPLRGEAPETFAYVFRVREGGATRDVVDPYRFPPLLTEAELQSMAAAANPSWGDRLGARPLTVDGTPGVHFVVWAPGAQRVSVVGDVNHWDGRVHPMRRHQPAGVWELFIPGLRDAANCEIEMRTSSGQASIEPGLLEPRRDTSPDVGR